MRLKAKDYHINWPMSDASLPNPDTDSTSTTTLWPITFQAIDNRASSLGEADWVLELEIWEILEEFFLRFKN